MNERKLRVAIDCDNAAINLKKVIYAALQENEAVEVVDLDYLGRGEADYPEIGYHLARKIQEGEFERGILICGTGLGMAIIANKVEGVYAGVCHDVYSAERLQKSNNAQVLTLGARVVGPELAKTIVVAWLQSEFAGGGSLPKVEQIRKLEQESFHPAAE